MSEIRWRAKNVATIDGFLSLRECDDYVRFGEAIGFAEAPISTSEGMIMMKDVRNNDRVMVDDAARAQALYNAAEWRELRHARLRRQRFR